MSCEYRQGIRQKRAEIRCMRNYRNLNVWNQSIELNKMVFSIFKALPKSDVYELQSQCRR